jgi:hypothetical protein
MFAKRTCGIAKQPVAENQEGIPPEIDPGPRSISGARGGNEVTASASL